MAKLQGPRSITCSLLHSFHTRASERLLCVDTVVLVCTAMGMFTPRGWGCCWTRAGLPGTPQVLGLNPNTP